MGMILTQKMAILLRDSAICHLSSKFIQITMRTRRWYTKLRRRIGFRRLTVSVLPSNIKILGRWKLKRSMVSQRQRSMVVTLSRRTRRLWLRMQIGATLATSKILTLMLKQLIWTRKSANISSCSRLSSGVDMLTKHRLSTMLITRKLPLELQLTGAMRELTRRPSIIRTWWLTHSREGSRTWLQASCH